MEKYFIPVVVLNTCFSDPLWQLPHVCCKGGLVDAYCPNNQATLKHKKGTSCDLFLKSVQMFLINIIIQNRTNLGQVYVYEKQFSMESRIIEFLSFSSWGLVAFFTESMTRGLTTRPVGPFFKAPFAFWKLLKKEIFGV